MNPGLWIECTPCGNLYVWPTDPRGRAWHQSQGFTGTGYQCLCSLWKKAISVHTGIDLDALEPGDLLDLKAGWVYYGFEETAKEVL